MIRVGNRLEKGMKEAAADLDVAEATLRRWIKQGRVPEPPVTRQGTRILKYFPEEYIEKVIAELDLGR